MEKIRMRMCSISWFQKVLNEYIAKRANKEEGIKGKFFESRFNSQVLADEKSLLLCSVYVDLNPIKAKMVKRLDDPQYTGTYKRTHNKNDVSDIQVNQSQGDSSNGLSGHWMGKFKKDSLGLKGESYADLFYPISANDYCDLLNFSCAKTFLEKTDDSIYGLELLDKLSLKESCWIDSLVILNIIFVYMLGILKS